MAIKVIIEHPVYGDRQAFEDRLNDIERSDGYEIISVIFREGRYEIIARKIHVSI